VVPPAPPKPPAETGKEKAGKKAYTVLYEVRHGTDVYSEGDPIDLDKKSAADLLSVPSLDQRFC